MVHELSKNGLAGIHPSLSAIGQGARRGGFSPARAQKSSNRKIGDSSYRTDSTAVINFRKTLAGQQCYPLYKIDLATGGATAIGSGTAFDVHGGDIYNAPEPASLMLCLLGGALLAARGLRRAG